MMKCAHNNYTMNLHSHAPPPYPHKYTHNRDTCIMNLHSHIPHPTYTHKSDTHICNTCTSTMNLHHHPHTQTFMKDAIVSKMASLGKAYFSTTKRLWSSGSLSPMYTGPYLLPRLILAHRLSIYPVLVVVAAPEGPQLLGVAAAEGPQLLGVAPERPQLLGVAPKGPQLLGVAPEGPQLLGVAPEGPKLLGVAPEGPQLLAVAALEGPPPLERNRSRRTNAILQLDL